jgi:hypothetical protein
MGETTMGKFVIGEDVYFSGGKASTGTITAVRDNTIDIDCKGETFTRWYDQVYPLCDFASDFKVIAYRIARAINSDEYDCLQDAVNDAYDDVARYAIGVAPGVN